MTKNESYKKGLRNSINHGLFSFIAVTAILYFGSSLFIPLFLSLVLFFIVSPLLPNHSKGDFKRWVVSLLITLGLATTFLISIYSASTPLFGIFQETSNNLSKIERKLIFMKQPILKLNEAEEKMESLTKSDKKKGALRVSVEEESMTESAFSFLQQFMTDFFMVFIFLIFFCVYGDLFLLNFARFIPFDYKSAVEQSMIEKLKKGTSRYFITVTVINIGLGASIGLGLFCIGFTDPFVWGLLAGLLNFIPYVGCIIGSALVFIVALPLFELSWQTFAAPAIYFFLNSIEGQLITPVVLGRTFCVNPLIIVIMMGYLSFLFGFVGLFLAVPLLLIVMTISDNTHSLEPLSKLLQCQDIKDDAVES